MPERSRDVVLVTGASGYVGGRLVPELLAAGHRVRCLARTPSKLSGFPWIDEVDVVRGDVTDRTSLATALIDVRAAYYLVHSMGGAADFGARDRHAAEAFRDAAAASGTVEQIVYLGGLADEADPDLSPHLRSRLDVGRTLAEGPVPVTELRAAIIIGSGSASFEMLRNLVDVLPVMVTPRWVGTRCQPVAIRDVLHWLVAAIAEPAARGRVLEIGGPDVLTYQEMMQSYADEAGLPRRLIVPVPVLSPRLSSLWVGLVTPLPAGLARPLVDSLTNEVVVRDRPAGDVLPHRPLAFREAVALALRRIENLDVSTTWASAELPGRPVTPAERGEPADPVEPAGRILTPADPAPTDPSWSGGTLLCDERQIETPADPAAVFATISGIGGNRGWYSGAWMWEARGLIDRVMGGVGLRRGRRHPDQLRVGDALDFWRVEAYAPPELLRLRAEMLIPGDAWLEWRVRRDGARTVLDQRAIFHPKGLWGRMYWYALTPFHWYIFGRLARTLARATVAA